MSSRERYTSIHQVSSLEQATLEDLRGIIRTYPVIDNHGHNLFVEKHSSTNDNYAFELITSEANGAALTEDSHSTLAHVRAIRQLSELLNCPPRIVDVKVTRDIEVGRNYEVYTKICLKGTHAILIDDGIKMPEGFVHSVRAHEKFVPRASRIVRIEKLAEDILEASIDWTGESKTEEMLVPVFSDPNDSQSFNLKPEQLDSFFSIFTKKFHRAISDLVSDPQVSGFKSVICYRTGLDINHNITDTDRDPLLHTWRQFLITALTTNNFRLKCKRINDFLVTTVCTLLSSRAAENPENKLPFQFHTGLGDTDLNLLKANPAHMQTLVEAYPKVNFVLLHSAYPYTREAGYLAAHYSNVFLDIGEVFPMLSRDGQKSVLRQTLELVPTSKVLWSTDGRFYPETYWLANKQFREVLEEVVLEYVEDGDLTIKEGIDAAVNILFWNSNGLYKLKEENRYPELLQACGRRAEHPHTITSVASQAPYTPTSTFSDLAKPGAVHDLKIWDEFYAKNPSLKYIWVQFLDYTATMRQRMVPVAQFREHLRQRSYPTVPLAAVGLLQNDILAPGASSTGQLFLVPDLSTLALNYVIKSPSATVQTWWQSNSDLGEIFDGCPRSMLSRQASLLKEEFDIDILMGFEIEVVFMRPILNESGSDFIGFEPIHKVHSWSNMTTQQLDLLPMIEEIVDTLKEGGIPIPQFHAESAPGQWEFPLPCSTPLKAVDTLYRARDIIRNVAKKHGLRATLYPRPFSNACGSASHVHFSINGPGARVGGREDAFLAGVLEHLPSILAFTLPIEESYARVMAGIWAGGVYVAWGTQNKEVPLRKCGWGHWELKTIDGIGNVYLSMTALLAAGYAGVKAGMPLLQRDCEVDASQIGDVKRRSLGISKMLPNTVEKAWAELEIDSRLGELLGYELVDRYLSVRRAERDMLRGLGAVDSEKRRVWLMSRY